MHPAAAEEALCGGVLLRGCFDGGADVSEVFAGFDVDFERLAPKKRRCMCLAILLGVESMSRGRGGAPVDEAGKDDSSF